VDSTTFFPRDRNACRERHGIRPAERIILCAGHLIELKGHHRIVHSLKRLVQDGTQARLLIAGGSGHRLSYEQVIRSEVSSLGLQESVSFLGHVEPEMLAELMCAADVFCLASSREGWPNVVHEAMSCGTPVVATDVGAIPEMIPSEDYGLIVPVNDGAALAGALHRALLRQWDRAAIAAHGQSRSWAEVAREVVSELQHIAGGRG
jgi:teichuronic acid biosynthesis glycosyltransferase TuaC